MRLLISPRAHRSPKLTRQVISCGAQDPTTALVTSSPAIPGGVSRPMAIGRGSRRPMRSVLVVVNQNRPSGRIFRAGRRRLFAR